MKIDDIVNFVSEGIGANLGIPESDVIDGLDTLKRWAYQFNVPLRNIETVFYNGLNQGDLQQLPLDNLYPHHDWDRRPDSSCPIIVGQTQDGMYVILDGQHRVLVAKEKGKTYIDGFVIPLPIKRIKLRKRSTWRSTE